MKQMISTLAAARTTRQAHRDLAAGMTKRDLVNALLRLQIDRGEIDVRRARRLAKGWMSECRDTLCSQYALQMVKSGRADYDEMFR